MRKLFLSIILVFNGATLAWADVETHTAITTTIPPTDLVGYDHYPQATKKLIDQALTLANQHLTYTYGSSDPKNKGMDCSGTIYYLLKQNKVNAVPRQANEMYQWTWQQGRFYPVNSHSLNSFEFKKLVPGDLLFWSGTYSVPYDPPVSHVMLYLGKNRLNQYLMFGASDGRTYQGKKMWGVSVYDFVLPSGTTSSKFLGYSCIPGYSCSV